MRFVRFALGGPIFELCLDVGAELRPLEQILLIVDMRSENHNNKIGRVRVVQCSRTPAVHVICERTRC